MASRSGIDFADARLRVLVPESAVASPSSRTAYFGGGIEAGEAIVQVLNGSAQALNLALFRREMDLRGVFCDPINRYVQAHMAFLT